MWEPAHCCRQRLEHGPGSHSPSSLNSEVLLTVSHASLFRARGVEHPGAEESRVGPVAEIIFWMALYLVETAILAWVVLGGGARRLEGTWFAELLSYRAILTSAGGLKIIAGLLWIGSTIWFVLGLFSPEVRWF